MPGSLSRTARVSALALGLAAAAGSLHGGAQVEPGPAVPGVEAVVPETCEAAVVDGASRRGGVSDADDWLG
jgi:hypothetical protein